MLVKINLKKINYDSLFSFVLYKEKWNSVFKIVNFKKPWIKVLNSILGITVFCS